MNKPTLLILSLGELSTALLEAVARTNLFDRIVVGSRSELKAVQRANNAIIGAGIEGYYSKIEGEKFDVDDQSFSTNLKQIDPDLIFSAPSLMPWWKLDKTDKPPLPFAGYMSLHLALMSKFRDRIDEANIRARWIGASYPDVINPILSRSGFGPDCGIGNVQEPIPKLKAGVARKLNCQPEEVFIHLVAQHAFEYYVLNDKTGEEFPPYLLKATVNGRDQSLVAESILREPFAFPYDLHFNRVTASAGIVALRALCSSTTLEIHLPGIKQFVGGYPARVSNSQIEINLPPEWSLDRAIDVNNRSLRWDGIELIENDGTVVFTEETQKAFHRLLGKSFERLNISNALAQSKELLAVL